MKLMNWDTYAVSVVNLIESGNVLFPETIYLI